MRKWTIVRTHSKRCNQVETGWAIRVKSMSGRFDVLWAKVEVLLDPVYDSASACAGRTYRNRNA